MQRRRVGSQAQQAANTGGPTRKSHDSRIRDHLPALRSKSGRDNADGCLPVFLQLRGLRCASKAEGRRLLRVLFLRLRALSADSGRAIGRGWRSFLLCRVSPHGRRYRSKLSRLAAHPAHQPFSLVDSSSRDPCRSARPDAGSSRHLDHGALLDGNGVHFECKALRTYPLPLHGTLLSSHDRPGTGAGIRYRFCRLLRMACFGGSYSRRKQDHLVGYRAGLGKVPVECSLANVGGWPTASVTSIRLARKVSGDKLPDSSGSPHLSDIKGLEVFRAAVGKFVMGIGGREPADSCHGVTRI